MIVIFPSYLKIFNKIVTVTTLSKVLKSVETETIFDLKLNSNAYKDTLTAVGIAASMIITFLYIGSIGIHKVINIATRGEIINLIVVT